MVGLGKQIQLLESGAVLEHRKKKESELRTRRPRSVSGNVLGAQTKILVWEHKHKSWYGNKDQNHVVWEHKHRYQCMGLFWEHKHKGWSGNKD